MPFPTPTPPHGIQSPTLCSGAAEAKAIAWWHPIGMTGQEVLPTPPLILPLLSVLPAPTSQGSTLPSLSKKHWFLKTCFRFGLSGESVGEEGTLLWAPVMKRMMEVFTFFSGHTHSMLPFFLTIEGVRERNL